jgi:hypothetical protein
MESDASQSSNITFAYCTVQLNAFSLMMITALSGLCGGIAWALILIIAEWLGIITTEKFDGPMEILIGFPVLGALGAGLFAIIGYPLYNWVCKNIRGQHLRGTFYNPRN